MDKWNYNIDNRVWNNMLLKTQLNALQKYYPIGKIFHTLLRVIDHPYDPGEYTSISKEEADITPDRQLGTVVISDHKLYEYTGKIYILTVYDSKHNITLNIHPSLAYPSISLNRDLLINRILE